jgi:hypothetical protein
MEIRCYKGWSNLQLLIIAPDITQQKYQIHMIITTWLIWC